ncbi:MAG TPA: hypothetical protein VGQ50_14315 [Actinomycetota bacterium]|nr:hypothetical protein [Actinomycetota bacterium]
MNDSAGLGDEPGELDPDAAVGLVRRAEHQPLGRLVGLPATELGCGLRIEPNPPDGQDHRSAEVVGIDERTARSFADLLVLDHFEAADRSLGPEPAELPGEHLR